MFSMMATSDSRHIPHASTAIHNMPLQPMPTSLGSPDKWDKHLEKPASEIHPFAHDQEDKVKPGPGEAVAASPHSAEAMKTYEEMSKVTPKFLV